MGLEEHLIGMFRGDFEFHEDAAPSQLGGHGGANAKPPVEAQAASTARLSDTATPPVEATPTPNEMHVESPAAAVPASWAPDAEKELRKIPFFVRGKARRNTERYAQEHRVPVITVETLYDAKAHFGS
jgi:light-independent protochlorophyllide reductase subunit B